MGSGQVTDALGVPGKGVHAHRTLGMATVDLAATVAVAVIAAAAWSRYRRSPFVPTAIAFTVALFALGVVAHVAFRVPTAGNKALGLA